MKNKPYLSFFDGAHHVEKFESGDVDFLELVGALSNDERVERKKKDGPAINGSVYYEGSARRKDNISEV